ncbi:MAG TPA: SDR family oxidoreductase [Anaerolineae bacterium]|nr:SDR family oxidoreductase [Anaerolineae bacterium]
MFNFADRTILVTGAAGNLGSTVAYKFDRAGANLALFDRRLDRLEEVCGDLGKSPNHLLIGSVDLTDPDSVENAVSRVIEHHGRIDVLVNTAGGYRAGTPVHETSLEMWDFMLNLNARTAFITCRAVIPFMLQAGLGAIINIGARPGLKGVANAAAYGASKSALIRLTESLSAELKLHGINVNCVLPGTIDTEENRKSTPDANYDRWVKPEAIADVILFLASDTAYAIHGATIPVYGTS